MILLSGLVLLTLMMSNSREVSAEMDFQTVYVLTQVASINSPSAAAIVDGIGQWKMDGRAERTTSMGRVRYTVRSTTEGIGSEDWSTTGKSGGQGDGTKNEGRTTEQAGSRVPGDRSTVKDEDRGRTTVGMSLTAQMKRTETTSKPRATDTVIKDDKGQTVTPKPITRAHRVTYSNPTRIEDGSTERIAESEVGHGPVTKEHLPVSSPPPLLNTGYGNGPTEVSRPISTSASRRSTQNERFVRYTSPPEKREEISTVDSENGENSNGKLTTRTENGRTGPRSSTERPANPTSASVKNPSTAPSTARETSLTDPASVTTRSLQPKTLIMDSDPRVAQTKSGSRKTTVEPTKKVTRTGTAPQKESTIKNQRTSVDEAKKQTDRTTVAAPTKEEPSRQTTGEISTRGGFFMSQFLDRFANFYFQD